MTVEENWSHYFKPEVRKQGFDYFSDGAVFLSIAADTQIQAFVTASSRIKVSFSTDSIASFSFLADCSCAASGKGQFCKHIWATLLAVQKSYPDFLDSKKEIEKGNQLKKLTPVSNLANAYSAIQDARNTEQKLKQSEYKKQQYQKHKERQKSLKQSEKTQKRRSTLVGVSPDVEIALKYFAENGFAFELPLNEAEVVSARKILSRIFHPDKGGSHDESLQLNKNYGVLMESMGRSDLKS